MDIDRAVRYWLDLAKDDLRVARHLLESGDRLHALFFCHLVLEKMLKGLFAKRRAAQPPPIHQLTRLAAEAGLKLAEEDKVFLEELTRFNIESRYPRDRTKLRKICTKKYTARVVVRVGQWRRRLVAEIRK